MLTRFLAALPLLAAVAAGLRLPTDPSSVTGSISSSGGGSGKGVRMGRGVFLGSLLAASSIPLMAMASGGEGSSDAAERVGPLVSLQGNIQKKLRPAARFPGLRTPHAWQERWEIDGTSEQFVSNLRSGTLDQLNASPAAGGFVYELDQATASAGTGRVTVSAFTKARWLDIIEVEIKDAGDGKNSVADVKSFSTGLFPLAVPGAALLNVGFFFFPFSDVGVPETKTCPDILKASKLNIKVVSRSRVI